MEEARYLELAAAAFDRVRVAFDDVDVDDADLESAGDVMTIGCRDGVRIVLNTQRPAREIWLAGAARAWHFAYDDARQEWRDPKRDDAELEGTLAELVRSHAGVELRFG